MTIAMFIDEENNFLVRRLIGHITHKDIMAAHAITPIHPHFKIGMNVIWDLTQADVGHFSTLDLKALSKMIREQNDWRGAHYKLAIAAPKEMDFIVSSTFSIISELENLPIEMRVFRKFSTAVNWLVSTNHCPDRSRSHVGSTHSPD